MQLSKSDADGSEPSAEQLLSGISREVEDFAWEKNVKKLYELVIVTWTWGASAFASWRKGVVNYIFEKL